jgi:hypothetical protein
MQGVKSTSIVYHDLDAIRKEPYACFCQEDENNCHLELYPRLNGTSYYTAVTYLTLLFF